MSRCPEPKSDADVRGYGRVAMISAHWDVWLRPVLLGGFGGMSDRSFHLFRSLVEGAGEEHVEGGGSLSMVTKDGACVVQETLDAGDTTWATGPVGE